MIILSIFIFLFSFQTQAQFSICGSYDILNTHPDEVRTSLVPKCMRQGHDFYLDGLIDDDLFLEITSNETEIKTLHLNSNGGRVTAVIQIAEFIREKKINTVIRKEAHCMSACTLLFQAGIKRTAHKEAQLMYHGARYPYQRPSVIKSVKECLDLPNKSCLSFIEKKRQRLHRKTEELFYLYTVYGATEELYEEYLTKGEDPHWIENGNYIQIENWHLRPLKALRYNIPTEVSLKKCEENQFCF